MCVAHRSSSHQQQQQQQYSYPPATSSSPSLTNTSEDGSERRKKRKSRWGDEQKVIMPGLPTSISKLNKEQSEKYLCKLIYYKSNVIKKKLMYIFSAN